MLLLSRLSLTQIPRCLRLFLMRIPFCFNADWSYLLMELGLVSDSVQPMSLLSESLGLTLA